MKILIVSFYDDNFGDMLIRTCFENILKCTLKSLGVDEKDYAVEKMNQKNIEEDKILSSDIVFFAGGALFGFNYQNFLEGIEKIISLTGSKNIPVVFSSLGVNNVASCGGEQSQLGKLLCSENIRALSVRESPSLFSEYLRGNTLSAVPVCDAAAWAGTIFGVKKSDSRTVGINVVRGGLFKANGLKWKIEDEENYLAGLKDIFDEKGVDYKFFTNGSVLDCNTLNHFAEKYEIPSDRLIYPDSSRQLIETVSSFGAVAAIRLHSSIVSYSLGVPSVNLNWNEKVPYFYENIGFSDRLVDIDENSAVNMAQKVLEVLGSKQSPSEEYLMSLYNFLFDTLKDIFSIESKEKYSFSKLTDTAKEIGVSEDDFIFDLTTKIKRGSFVYYKLFKADREKGKRIKALESEKAAVEEKYKEYEKRISSFDDEINKANEKIKYYENLAEKFRTQYNEEFEKSSYYKSLIDGIAQKPLVKMYLKDKDYPKK